MSENTPESKTQNIPDSAADALAANTNTSGRLNGNEAVNMAAEAWKDAAGQNIPAFKFADEPLESDTANLRQGPSLNDALLGLLPLVGVWQGEGEAHDSEGKQFHFGQQLVVAHDGGEYLTFSSRTWKIDSEGTAGEPYASSNGIVEIFYGEVFNERAWQLQSASTMVTETGPKNLGPGKRMYGLMPNNNLGWVDERLVDDEMRPYMSAELRRVAG